METTLPILNSTGTQTGDYELKANCLEEAKGDQAVHDVVVAFLAKLRAGTAKTKTKGEVSGGGRKPWKQKGTGRARAGSIRSPIWRGGGITFGPQPRSYAKDVNRSLRRLALKRTFTERLKENAIIIVDSIDLPEIKTKCMTEYLKRIGAGNDTLIVLDELTRNVVLTANNLPGVEIMKATSVNPYWMLLFKKIVFTRPALDLFIKRLNAERAEV